MGRRFRRTSRRSGSRRRKTLWAESNLGVSSSAIGNNAVITGWLAFPAGQYDFGFTPPAFQPEDLTHVRSLLWWNFQVNVTPSADRASSFTVGAAIWPFTVQDGNVYQNTLISTSGVGSVPNPATIGNHDYLWTWKTSIPAHQFTAGVAAWLPEIPGVDSGFMTRAQRKLSHDQGLLMLIGWDWDDPTLSQNGDTLAITANITGRSLYKEP